MWGMVSRGRRDLFGLKKRGESVDKTDSFITGWNYGKAQKKEISSRELDRQFPDVESDYFVQGMVDGVIGDRFRLELVFSHHRGLKRRGD